MRHKGDLRTQLGCAFFALPLIIAFGLRGGLASMSAFLPKPSVAEKTICQPGVTKLNAAYSDTIPKICILYYSKPTLVGLALYKCEYRLITGHNTA